MGLTVENALQSWHNIQEKKKKIPIAMIQNRHDQ